MGATADHLFVFGSYRSTGNEEKTLVDRVASRNYPYSTVIVHLILRSHRDIPRVRQQPHPIVSFPSMRCESIVAQQDRIYSQGRTAIEKVRRRGEKRTSPPDLNMRFRLVLRRQRDNHRELQRPRWFDRNWSVQHHCSIDSSGDQI